MADPKTPSEQAAVLEDHAAQLRKEAQRLLSQAAELDHQAMELEGKTSTKSGEITSAGLVRDIRGVPHGTLHPEGESQRIDPPVDELVRFGNEAYVRRHPYPKGE